MRRSKHKSTRCPRAHGRPPDFNRHKLNTSDQHDTSVASSHVFVPSESETTNVSLERVLLVLPPDAFQFLDPDSSQFTAHDEKTHSVPDLPRTAGAGIRAALQSPLSSATVRRQMTVIAPLAVKTSKLNIPDA